MIRRGITTMGLGSALTLGVALLVPPGLYSPGFRFPWPAPPAPPPPSISVIQSLSELATTRVHLSDIIEGENAHYKGRWTLHGEALLGVDLSKVIYLHTDPAKREAVLGLPSPHVISSKVDHERSDEIRMEWAAWVPLSTPKALRDEVWKQADRKLQRLAEDPGYLERTRVQTERVLAQVFTKSGWKVTFEWQDGAAPQP